MKRIILTFVALAAMLLTSCVAPVNTPEPATTSHATTEATKTKSATTPEVTPETTLAAPTLLYPNSNATRVSKLTYLSWAPVTGATEYQLIVAKDADLQLKGASVNVAATAVRGITLTDNTTYFWSVQVIKPTVSKQTIARFTTNAQLVYGGYTDAMLPPIPLTPRHGSATSLRPGFSWSYQLGATEYEFKLVTDIGFTDTITMVNLPETSYQLTSDLKPDTDYYWSVRVTKPTTGEQTISTFTTKKRQPVEGVPHGPFLLTPPDGSTTSLRPSFSWSSETDATEYEFVLATDAILTNSITNVNPPETSHQLTFDLEPNTDYYWAVRASKPYRGVLSFGRFRTSIR